MPCMLIPQMIYASSLKSLSVPTVSMESSHATPHLLIQTPLGPGPVTSHLVTRCTALYLPGPPGKSLNRRSNDAQWNNELESINLRGQLCFDESNMLIHYVNSLSLSHTHMLVTSPAGPCKESSVCL